MKDIEVMIPATVTELTGLLKGADACTKLVAGGTDLVIALHEGRIKPERLIDLSGIAELEGIAESPDYIEIGASTTFSAIAANEMVRRIFPSLVQAAEGIGSKQIRNRGTIGGNVANASPAGDTITALVSLHATAIIVNSENHRREAEVGELVTGPGKTALSADEAILSIRIPLPQGHRYSRFEKLGTRSAVTIARLNIAVNLGLDDQVVITTPIVALGAVGAKVFRARMAEDALLGKKLDRETAERFADALVTEVDASIPGRASQPYKREAIRALAYDVLGIRE